MIKTILISIFVVIALAFTSRFFDFSGKIISPLSNTQQVTKENPDDLLFQKYRDKVKVDGEWNRVPAIYGVGNGVEDNLVTDANYIVVGDGGKVALAHKPDEKHAPASLTKIMTAMVTLDFAQPSDVYTVPSEATNLEPTVLLLDEGEKLSVEDLMTGALITSANDAAYVLAYGTAKNLGGSYQLFVQLMNEKAKNLELTNTHFANATGYDNSGHYASARDLAVMTQYALTHYPEIKKIVARQSASIAHTQEHKVYELPNWNALLGVYPGVDGVKIGHTDLSGHSTIVTSTREDKRFLVVLLGAPDMRARDKWTAELLNKAFDDVGVSPFKVSLGMLQKRSGEWGDQLILARKESEEAGETVVRKVDLEKTREE